jgi:hypothetical protein
VSVTDAKLPLRVAMEAGDRAAVVAAFAEDGVLRSPFTDTIAFEGRAQFDTLIGVLLDVLGDLSYIDEVRAGPTAVLVGRARVDGQTLQFVDYLKLDPQDLVKEMTVLFRPLPATTAALRRIGQGLGASKSPLRGRLVSAMAAPLAFAARRGDSVGMRLVRP